MKVTRFQIILGAVVAVAIVANVVIWQRGEHGVQQMIAMAALLSSPRLNIPEHSVSEEKEFWSTEPCEDGPDIAECEFQKGWRLFYQSDTREKGLAFLTSAAKRGHPPAQAKLGDIYSYGEFVSPDPEVGFQWSLKAAENGDEGGMVSVALCYGSGLGVPKDPAKELAWFIIQIRYSGGISFKPADSESALRVGRMPELTADMKPEDIEAAKKMADEWIAAHPELFE